MHAPSVMSLCRRYMQNKEEAEEVLMNGFVKIFTNLNTYTGDGNLEHEVDKSKLTTLFIDAPILLQIDLSKDKKEEGGFNIAIGPYVGYLLKAKSKYVYTDANNNSNTDKLKGDFFVNKVRYGLQSQFGVLGLKLLPNMNYQIYLNLEKDPKI